ncbi:MAG: hypothetical protein E7111_01880 [Bacteroidales bacterium]|nr:hypothetical protein [Bacteroidales bacterium]
MKINISRLSAVIALILPGLVSCVTINEELGDNFIPEDKIWNVFPCESVTLEDITMKQSDKLSGYSTSRITFGSIKDGEFGCDKSSSFTLVPLMREIDFGTDPRVLQFHFTALRDTVSTLGDGDKRMLQNVYIHTLKQPLDSTILYAGTFTDKAKLDEYVDFEYGTITKGIPVYNGGDSLSFDFSDAYATKVIEGIQRWQELEKEKRDSLAYYLKEVPGIYISTDHQTADGGRINMFDLPLAASDGYLDANYAELKIRSKYDEVEKDTLFIFYFGPSEFLKDDATSYPSQYAFNSSDNYAGEDFFDSWENSDRSSIYVEGGSGYKPVIKAAEIKRIVDGLIAEKASEFDKKSIVINRATILLPYNVGTSYGLLDKYPQILSPTVRLVSDDDKYVTYAGLTDSSIESENQGDINRSLSTYMPDVSHHVQEIVKLERGVGEDIDPNETEEEFEERLSKYDIWFLIMHEEVTESSSSSSAYDDYYNSLMYNSYYNNMMYDPYGYGYGYGYGGYGYGYSDYYGYNNYYNYYMMAQYANASSSSTSTSSIELDRDRFYNAKLNGPGATENRPSLKITFSAPHKSE